MRVDRGERRFGCAGVLLIAGLAVLVFGGAFIGIYTDWMWFAEDVRKPEAFVVILRAKWALFAAGFLLASVFAAANWMPALRATIIVGRGRSEQAEQVLLRLIGWVQRSIVRLLVVVAPITGLFFGAYAASAYDAYLVYANAITIGQADPVFGRDLGFYLFQYDFSKFVAQFCLVLVVAVGLATYAIYNSSRALGYLGGIKVTTPNVRTHLLILIALTLLALAWNLSLFRYRFLFESTSVFTGASYTDLHARIPLLSVLTWGCVALAALALANIRLWTAFVPVGCGLGLLVAVALLGYLIYPQIIEQALVVPNQFQKEWPFISRNIVATRKAFALDAFVVKSIPYTEEPTTTELDESRTTLDNMRVWDPRVLGETYNNLQALRPYYHFRDSDIVGSDDNGIDVDRYTINGRQRVMMLSARELYLDGLPTSAQTWQSLHLQYTHGYGVVMNQVNAATPDGLPQFLLKNIPPVGPPEVRIDVPGIYYGEMTSGHILASSRVPELDFPSVNAAEANFTSFKGNSGIQIGQNGFLSRLMFSLKFGDSNLMLTGDLTERTRLLYRRNVAERVRAVYPFLRLDPDPYIVVADGRLYWMLDAYTHSDSYPYSSVFADAEGAVNYMRNSVKIVVNAYDGSVIAYAWDMTDPMLRVYRRIFPRLFTDRAQMPAALLAHVRYPERLFQVQAAMYRFYHITDPRLFFQKEDAWDFPKENLEVNMKVLMRPYYVQMRVPDRAQDAFQLILPFTPLNRQNMVGWMSADCDPSRYGRITVYRYPESSMVPGPEMVYSFFQQNPEISPQMTLWNSPRGGSQAIFGNLIVTPIGNSLLYSQPVYLRAANEGRQSVPALHAVMVGVGNRTTIGPTFNDALRKLLSDKAAKVPATSGQQPAPTSRDAAFENLDSAVRALEKTQQSVDEQLRRIRESLQKLRSNSRP